MDEGSKRFKLNWSDLTVVVKNAILVGGAAALTVVAENLQVVDIGLYTPLVVPIIAVALDTAIKWLKNAE
jgi:hypothetical protein|tara:strand:+ start:425 stop:634 length:210 start_codon:yes stop_codon:yes gene_type:complete